MSDLSPETSPSSATVDRRVLTAIKVLLIVLLIGLVAARDNDLTWPFVTWTMFAESDPHPPGRTYSGVILRAIDGSGQSHIVWPTQLYSFLDFKQVSDQLVYVFRLNDPAVQRAGFADLAAQVSKALPGVNVVVIQAWLLQWPVQTYQSPPFDPLHPLAKVLVGGFRVADVAEAR